MNLALQVLAGASIGLALIGLLMWWAGRVPQRQRNHHAVVDVARWRMRAIQRATVLELLRTAETMKASESASDHLPDIVIDVDEETGA